LNQQAPLPSARWKRNNTQRLAAFVWAYQVEGYADKPPIMLLHALGGRGTSWAPVKGRFADRFRVFTVDLRGHGDSD